MLHSRVPQMPNGRFPCCKSPPYYPNGASRGQVRSRKPISRPDNQTNSFRLRVIPRPHSSLISRWTLPTHIGKWRFGGAIRVFLQMFYFLNLHNSSSFQYESYVTRLVQMDVLLIISFVVLQCLSVWSHLYSSFTFQVPIEKCFSSPTQFRSNRNNMSFC